MPITRNRRGTRLTTRNEFRIDINSMKGGVNTLVSESRLKKDQAKELQNMWLIEDGVADKRPGTAAYGTVTFTNRPDGAKEYTKTDGTRELIVVADGVVQRVTTTTKTTIGGATFTQGTRCYFLQYNNFLYIANGVDALARYDGSTLAAYTGISAPTWDATPIVRTGLTAGSFPNYYEVSAVNDVGETLATSTANFTSNLPRDSWDASNYMTLGWADVSGATKYNVYWADTDGFEVLLDESTASTYKDTGGTVGAVSNPYIETPDADTTTGPKFTSMAVSGNRIWATGDPTNKYRAFFSGTGVNKGNFAPGYGGGWIDLEKGGQESTVAVLDFQGVPHFWTKTADGHGSVWQIKIETKTIQETTFEVPIPNKIIGSVGCDSGRGPVLVGNDILFPNKQGVFVIGNAPNVEGVLQTQELSSAIRPDWRSLSGDSLDKIATYYYNARAYFAVPKSSGQPDTIYIFDRERAAWIKDWTLGVSQFLEFTDSSGTTHFLGIAATNLIEFDPVYESDSGTAFTWRYKSGRLSLDKEWHKFGRVYQAFIRLRNATGSVDVTLTGIGISNQYSTTGSSSITISGSNAGLGWDEFGAVMFGDTDGTPTVFASESLIKYLTIEHNKNIIRDIQWTVSGDSTNDRAVITGLAVAGKESNVPLALSDKI